MQKKVILITGCSRGIGRSLALAKARAGCTVIILSRNVAKLETLYDEIISEDLPEPAIYPFNLATASYDDYLDLKRIIDQNFGKLDELILNAGVLGVLTPIEYFEVNKWYQTMQVNQNSSFMLIQVCIPLLKRSKNASIIFNIPDIAENIKPNWGAYAVASAGTKAMAKMLQLELENTNIEVRIVTPPPTDTNLRKQVYPAENREALAKPEEVVDMFFTD